MLSECVREHCAAVAATARHVVIDVDAASYDGGVSGLDPELHRLDGSPEDVARYVLILDAVNFGSAWFEELGTDTNALTAALTLHGTPWSAAELRALTPAEAGAVLGLPPHDLTDLYARALNQLGGWLGDAPVLPRLGRSAQSFAASLLDMPLFADPGFYKRAQITANDLVLAGVADFDDVDRLTVFADNMLPHVLRADGVLVHDLPEELEHGSRPEVELRACAVHACELLAARAGVPPRTLDNWLWHRGVALGGRPHRCRTTAY